MLLLIMVIKEGLSRYFIKLNNFNGGTINTNSNTHEYHTTFRDCRFTVAFFGEQKGHQNMGVIRLKRLEKWGLEGLHFY